MKTLQQLEKLKQIHQHIKHEKTGSPNEFAGKLRMSRRQLYYFIEYLKEIDAPILYRKRENTFYYSSDFDLRIKVEVQVLVNEELKTIYGGYTILEENFLCARLLH